MPFTIGASPAQGEAVKQVPIVVSKVEPVVVEPPEPVVVAPEPVEAPKVVETVKAPAVVQSEPVEPPVYAGSHEDWMAAAGISPADYSYVDYIVSHESGWSPTAQNLSGAYGLCQSMPGIKMATISEDWATNPVTQLIWCTHYADNRGGWQVSYQKWVVQGWW